MHRANRPATPAAWHTEEAEITLDDTEEFAIALQSYEGYFTISTECFM